MYYQLVQMLEVSKLIKHEETGFIVNIGDSEQAAQYAIQLLENPNLYKQMQSKMLEDIRDRFASKLITDQYEHYYKKMLEQGEN